MENSKQLISTPTTEVNSVDVNPETWYSMSKAAKLICTNMGRQKLYIFLRERKILMNDKEPYQKYINQKYFKYVLKAITDKNGKVLFYQPVILVSVKGLFFIKGLLEQKTDVKGIDNKHQYNIFS